MGHLAASPDSGGAQPDSATGVGAREPWSASALLAFITRWIIDAILLKITDAMSDTLTIDGLGWALDPRFPDDDPPAAPGARMP